MQVALTQQLPIFVNACLARFGGWMQRNRAAVQGVQWSVVIGYLLLLVYPAFLPLPSDQAHLYDDLVLFAQFAFWGVWWPFVMVSMVLLGRTWCGVFCPEGVLTEWSGNRGLRKAIPHWMRWGGWPFVAFVCTTIYGQLVSVYEYPKAALLILGGSTVAAMLIGFVYGRGKRVWCRYLCPANGVFSLLSRLAPVQFQVDAQKWKQAPHGVAAVDCAPLINIRNMTSNRECHMCGRCAGHRNAVTLGARPMNQELLALKGKEVSGWDGILLLFGMLGLALGAFQWSASPWFVAMKQISAEWLIEKNALWALEDNIPWWVLTHYPESNDVFSWLDGACILIYIITTALLVGGALLVALWTATRILRQSRSVVWELSYAFIPLAGVNIFLGLSALTVSMLRAEHVPLGWVPSVRIALLVIGYVWSGYLLWRMIRQRSYAATKLAQRILAWGLVMLTSGCVAAAWVLLFYIW